MANLPTQQVIHVKRKRDDTPIDSLYLESASKRARSATLLPPKVFFKRLSTAQPLTQLPPELPLPPEPAHLRRSSPPPIIRNADGVPEILSSPESEEERDPYALRQYDRVTRERALGAEKRHVVLQTSGQGHDEGMKFAIDKIDAMEVDSEYVYDVFVRESGTSSIIVPQVASAGVAKVVVGDEHEEWLENYFWDGNDEEEDRVYSDDEDSNAEDYYGADYPEDEESSDDNDFSDEDDEYGEQQDEYVADYDDQFHAMSSRY